MTDLQWIVLRGADDHVIDQVDADDLRCLTQLPCQLNILGAWRRVAARMVVLCCAPSYVE